MIRFFQHNFSIVCFQVEKRFTSVVESNLPIQLNLKPNFRKKNTRVLSRVWLVFDKIKTNCLYMLERNTTLSDAENLNVYVGTATTNLRLVYVSQLTRGENAGNIYLSLFKSSRIQKNCKEWFSFVIFSQREAKVNVFKWANPGAFVFSFGLFNQRQVGTIFQEITVKKFIQYSMPGFKLTTSCSSSSNTN